MGDDFIEDEERPEEDEDYKALYRKLDAHALAIGHVCFAWADLEVFTDSLLQVLIGVDGQQETAQAVTTNMDLRAKTEIIKAVAYVKKPSDPWFKDVIGIIDDIDLRLRPERNRDIHDYWMYNHPEEGVTTRYTSRARLKTSPRGHHTLTTFQEKPIKPTEIWDLVHSIRYAAYRLGDLSADYLKATDNRKS
jgi:hypothetical protein